MTTAWEHDPDEDEALLASAVAVVEFARAERHRLHPVHPRRLVNDAAWFLTERGSPSRKYRLRYRTAAALELQESLGMVAAMRHLAHEPRPRADSDSKVDGVWLRAHRAKPQVLTDGLAHKIGQVAAFGLRSVSGGGIEVRGRADSPHG